MNEVQIDDVNTYYLLIAGVEPNAELKLSQNLKIKKSKNLIFDIFDGNECGENPKNSYFNFLRYRIIREVDGTYHRKQRKKQREQRRKQMITERQRRRRSRSPSRGRRTDPRRDAQDEEEEENGGAIITPYKRRALADISWIDFTKFDDFEMVY